MAAVVEKILTKVVFVPASALFLLLSYPRPGHAQDDTQDTRPSIAPDLREDELGLKVQRGNFVVVPVPISNPTLHEGLVVGAAYFYPQTEAEKKRQPASLTAAGAMYTNNDSRAIALVQQNYWRNNRWRFTGAAGATDLRLSLRTPEDPTTGSTPESRADWRIQGKFVYAKLSRKLKGKTYLGLFTRLIDADQSIDEPVVTSGIATLPSIVSAGLGAVVEYDSRDNPFNSGSGRHLKVDALFNDDVFGSDANYQLYSAAYRSYHRLADSLVLAWELQGCTRSGSTPLWDACTVKLRGFSATDYLAKTSTSGQAEARWQLSKRWGLAGFAGAGYVSSSFSESREREAIPSYGVGVRFSVLPAKGINLRLDYARSSDSDAIHFSVGEAF